MVMVVYIVSWVGNVHSETIFSIINKSMTAAACLTPRGDVILRRFCVTYHLVDLCGSSSMSTHSGQSDSLPIFPNTTIR